MLEDEMLEDGLNPAVTSGRIPQQDFNLLSMFSSIWFLFHGFKIYVLHPVAHND